MEAARRFARLIVWAGLVGAAWPAGGAEWATLGGDAGRRGLSEYRGPKLGCLKWAQGAAGAVYHGVVLGSEGQVYSVTANGILTATDGGGNLLWEYALGDVEILELNLVDGQIPPGGPNLMGAWDAIIISARVPAAGFLGDIVSLGPTVVRVVERNGVPVFGFRNYGVAGSVFGATPANVQAGAELKVVVPQGARTWSDVQIYIDGVPERRLETYGDAIQREITSVGFLCSDAQVKVYRGEEDVVSHPTVGPEGTVYVGFGDVLYAVGADGVLRWKHQTGAFVYSCPAVDELGRVFFGSADGAVYALGPDGSELWRFAVPGPGVIGGAVLQPPSIGRDGSIYVGGMYKSTLFALDPADGGIRWQSQLNAGGETGGSFIVAPVVGPDGTVYVTMVDDPHLYALDPADGAVKWATDLAHEPELVGYWKFDEGVGDVAYDSSMYERPVKPSSSYSHFVWADGVLGRAISYGPGQNVVQRFGWDVGTVGRTMCFWVRVSPGGVGDLVTWSGGDSVALSMVSGPRIQAAINGGHLVGKTPLRGYEWRHVAIVVADDGATTGMDDVRIYLDGCLDADFTSNGGFAASTSRLRIDTASATNINLYISPFRRIDDFRLYETALSAEQIQELMWDETAPTFTALRAPTSGVADGRGSWSEVAVGPDGTIYAGFDDPYLRAINPDGTLRWIKHLACGGNYTMAVGADDLVYAAGADGVLYAIRPDGKLVSRFDAGGHVKYVQADGPSPEDTCELNYPVVAGDGTVYASDTGGKVWALSREACEGPPYALTCQDVLGDVNKDCVVNLTDFAFVAADWLACTEWYGCDDALNSPWHYVPGYYSPDYTHVKYLPGDVNQSMYVGLDDVAWLMRIWLSGAGFYE